MASENEPPTIDWGPDLGAEIIQPWDIQPNG